MEFTNEEKRIIEAMRKVPKKGESRLSVTFLDGKISAIDLTSIERMKLN